MTPATETTYTLQEIVRMQGDADSVVISTANLRKLTAEIDSFPDILLKAERTGRSRYQVRLDLRMTPKRLEKELSTRYA